MTVSTERARADLPERRDAQSDAPLADAARRFLADGSRSFTTPGHKRSPDFGEPVLALDFPLHNGADDARLTGDLLLRAEALAAALWGAGYCRFSVAGSTQGNQALALGLTTPGGRVVASRTLHKSLFAGFALAGVTPTWIVPEVDLRTGLPLPIAAHQLEAALQACPDAQAAFVVEPSYVGLMGDVGALAEVAHAHGVPLAADQAWGAHLGFGAGVPGNVLRAGADAMVTSLHKTLTAFSQGAAMFARGELIDVERLDAAFELINTTSPAGPILATLDRTRQLMAARGPRLVERTAELAAGARARLAAVEGVRVVDDDLIKRFPQVSAVDPCKLVISLAGTGANGFDVERDLERAGVRLEMADAETLVPLLTIADTAEGVDALVTALVESIERRRGPARDLRASSAWRLESRCELSPREALAAPRRRVSASAAVGRVAAETAAPYPPGIPALAPGEVVTAELIDALREEAARGSRIAYCSDPRLETVLVVDSRQGDSRA